jgi:hypothetical protein
MLRRARSGKPCQPLHVVHRAVAPRSTRGSAAKKFLSRPRAPAQIIKLVPDPRPRALPSHSRSSGGSDVDRPCHERPQSRSLPMLFGYYVKSRSWGTPPSSRRPAAARSPRGWWASRPGDPRAGPQTMKVISCCQTPIRRSPFAVPRRAVVPREHGTPGHHPGNEICLRTK